MDIIFPAHNFARQWNLTEDGGLWIMRPSSIDQIGCIHTCQGLECDYVGVIIGNTYRTLMTRGMKGCAIWFAPGPD